MPYIYKFNLYHVAVLVIFISFMQCSMSKLGVFFQSTLTYPTTSVLKCIKDKNYQDAQLMVTSSTKGIKHKVADYVVSIKNAELMSEVVLAPCHGRSVSEEVKDFASKIKKDYLDRLWLTELENFDEDICEWPDTDPTANCKLMTEFLDEFKKEGYNVGFAAKESTYNEDFGENCKSMSGYPLYWSPDDEDTTKSFKNYHPFGGWSIPTKKFLDNKFICGSMGIISYQPDSTQ